MGLPAEFHVQCQLSLEKEYLMDFYSWAKDAAFSMTDKILGLSVTESEDKVCSAALFQILNWKVISFSVVPSRYLDNSSQSRFEWSVLKAGTTWHGDQLSSQHILWLLNLYATLHKKHLADVIWIDSPLAVSARQLIKKLCSWICIIFSSDNGENQLRLVLKILDAIHPWIYPSVATSTTTRFRQTRNEIIDACHVLLSLATLTTTRLFNESLIKQRFEATVKLLSVLTIEVLGAISVSNDRAFFHFRGIGYNIGDLECHYWAAAESTFNNDDISSHFHAPESKGDEVLGSYALIARPLAEITIPFLMTLFSERFDLHNQTNGGCDTIRTSKELSCLLLITGHVLTDSSEIPNELLVKFDDTEESSHPIVILSSIGEHSQISRMPKIWSGKFSFSVKVPLQFLWDHKLPLKN